MKTSSTNIQNIMKQLKIHLEELTLNFIQCGMEQQDLQLRKL